MSFDFDFEVAAGEFRVRCALVTEAKRVALIGPNGAGKTTLLRALVGGLKPSRGVIRVGEVAFYDASKGLHLKPEQRNVGYVPQSGGLLPHLSALGNVSFPLLSGGEKLRAEERQARALEALARFGAEAVADRNPSELSGGECRRVALARALVGRPSLLVLDEPFAGVDVTRRPKLRESLLAAVKETGAQLVVTTHDAQVALGLSEVVAICEEGEVSGVSEHSETPLDAGSEFLRSFLG